MSAATFNTDLPSADHARRLKTIATQALERQTQESLYWKRVAVANTFIKLSNDGALDLVLATLRSYKLTRPQLLELQRASKFFYKKPASVGNAVKDEDGYFKSLEQMVKWFHLIESIIERSDVCSSEAHCQAACFKIVNGGGFPAKTIALAETQVTEAAKLIEKKGFGDLCYGEVIVTNKLARDNVRAFYLQSDDRMYVRANVRDKGRREYPVGPSDVVYVIVHELGHRLEHRFMTETGKRFQREIYAEYRAAHRFAEYDTTTVPYHSVGTRVKMPFKGGLEEVEVVQPSKMQAISNPGAIVLKKIGQEDGPSYVITRDAWYKLLGAKMHGDHFPSDYAKTSPGELLAELFAHYVLGKLEGRNLRDFDKMMAGTKWSGSWGPVEKKGMARGRSKCKCNKR